MGVINVLNGIDVRVLKLVWLEFLFVSRILVVSLFKLLLLLSLIVSKAEMLILDPAVLVADLGRVVAELLNFGKITRLAV